MRTNLIALRRCVNMCTRKYCSRNSDYKESTNCSVWRNPESLKAPPKRPSPHMDELPVPCGEFYYFAKERRMWYQLWLLVGIVWFTLSVAVMVASGSFELNAFPPHTPSASAAAVRDPVCVATVDLKSQLERSQ